MVCMALCEDTRCLTCMDVCMACVWVCVCVGVWVCVRACAYYVFSVVRGHTALNTRIYIICPRTQRVSCKDTRGFTCALRTPGVSHIPHTHTYTQGPYTYTYVRGHRVSCLYVCLYDLVCVCACVRACVRACVFQESSNRKRCAHPRELYLQKESSICKKRALSAKRELYLQKESSICKKRALSAKRELYLQKDVHICKRVCAHVPFFWQIKLLRCARTLLLLRRARLRK